MVDTLVNAGESARSSSPQELAVKVLFNSGFGRWGASAAPANGLSLAGEGSVTVRDGSITVSGKVIRSFQPTKTIALDRPLGAVANVDQDDNRVRLDIQMEDGKWIPMAFWTECEIDARNLASKLPTLQTESFRKAVEEEQAYAERLEDVGATPWVCTSLVALNILAFIVLALAGGGIVKAVPDVLLRWGTNFGPYTIGGQWWRLLSAMFIHFGAIHLLLNMWALWNIGQMAERFFGSAYFLLLYFASGIAGGLTSLWWHPAINSAGASGAIFGILGGLLLFVTRKNSGIPVSDMKPLSRSILVFGGYSLFYGFVHGGIDNAAHVGGLATGALIGLVLSRPINAQERSSEGARPFARGFLLSAVVLCGLWVGVTHPSEATRTAIQLQRNVQQIAEADERLVKTLQEAAAREKAGTANDKDLADRVERDFLPEWISLSNSTPVVQAQGSSREERLREAYGNYVLATRDALALLVAAQRQNSQTKLEEMKAAFTERRKWGTQIQQLNATK